MNKGTEAIRKSMIQSMSRYCLTDGSVFPRFNVLLARAREKGYVGSPALLHLRYSKGITCPAKLFANPDPKKSAHSKKVVASRQEKSRDDVQAALERLGPPRRY